MKQAFDSLGQYEKPEIILCNPNGEELYSLNLARNITYKPRFNAVSELSFVLDESVNGTINPAYVFLASKRIVYIMNIGYFVISDPVENTDGKIPYKEVTAYSREIELSFKKITISGTIKFYDAISPEDTLLYQLLSYAPSWSVGTVDLSVAALYRTFDVSDANIYEFMMNDVEKAYSCIFFFDTINKTISVTALENATTTTDIYLSYDNLLQQATLKEISSEICTKMYVYGAGGLNINSVNPLGTNAVYDFSYYKTINWMSEELITAIEDWEGEISTQQPTYQALIETLITKNTELIVLEGELSDLETEYSALEEQQSVMIAGGLTDTPEYDALLISLAAKQVEIDGKQGDMTTKQDEIDATTVSITAIVDSLSFESNFTNEQIILLDAFIFENTYQNENIVTTDTDTVSERLELALELYNDAITVLEKVSVPRYEFSGDSANFVFMEQFSEFTDQLALGCAVTIQSREGFTITPVLLEMSITYDDPTSFSMTFSNRLRLDGADFIFTDLFGNNNKISTAVGLKSSDWGNWTTHKDDVTTFINSALDASLNKLINASNEEITITSVGLRGQKYDPDTETYDPHKVWLTSNVLAFTRDDWNSAALALGSITTDVGEFYGLVAEVLVGNIIAGNSLTITNEDGTFTVDGNGATLTDAKMTITGSAGRVVIDPDSTQIFKTEKLVGAVWNTNFWLDSDGDLYFAGELSGATGTFSGALSAATGTFSGALSAATGSFSGSVTVETLSGRVLMDATSAQIFKIEKKVGASWVTKMWVDGDGDTYFAGELSAATGTFSGDISAASGVFTGNIYADKIYGQLVDAQISDVGAGKITAGTIFGSNIQWPGVTMYSPGYGLSIIEADDTIEINAPNGSIEVSTLGVSVAGLNNTVRISTIGAGQHVLIDSPEIQIQGNILSRQNDEMDEGYGATATINPNSYNNFKFINGILVDYY